MHLWNDWNCFSQCRLEDQQTYETEPGNKTQGHISGSRALSLPHQSCSPSCTLLIDY